MRSTSLIILFHASDDTKETVGNLFNDEFLSVFLVQCDTGFHYLTIQQKYFRAAINQTGGIILRFFRCFKFSTDCLHSFII